jgi:branched-chain amino acid transport system permease protein
VINVIKLNKKTQFFLTIIFIAVIILLLFTAEENLNSYIVRIITLIGIYGIMSVSLNLINGVSGVLSLGHAGFVAVGAYISSLLTMSIYQKESIFIIQKVIWPFNSIEMPFLFATIIGGIVAAVFAFLVGWPSLRLSGDYFAITTLGFAEIIRILALNLTSVTNGALGLKSIPSYTNIWWAWGWLLVTIIVIASYVNGTFGRALRAIREDKIAAASMGINVYKHQLITFVLGGFFAGISGSLYAHWLTTIDPRTNTIGIMLTFNILIMVLIGGLGSISGSIIGAGLFAILSEVLRFFEEPIKIFNFEIAGISGMRMLIFSALFVLIMILRPKGILGRKEITWNNVFNLFHRKGDK